MGWFLAAAATLVVAECFSLADLKRIWCDPGGLLQGHAVWHVLSACAFPMLYRHYAEDFDRAWARP